jgi:MATE family multidrug resistance protein
MGAQGEVAAAASTYLVIRALSAPAALANYAILGYVLGRGMGGTGLLLQSVINGTNIILSIWFGLGLDYGLEGVALATVIAEITGCAMGFLVIRRRFDRAHSPSWKQVIDRPAVLRLMALNGDIMIRSFALIAAFAWFTRQGTGFGETTLAANAILMNFFMVAGYYLDGFATAAEQLAGRAIGARHRPAFNKAVTPDGVLGICACRVHHGVFPDFRKCRHRPDDDTRAGSAGSRLLSFLGGADGFVGRSRLRDGRRLHWRHLVA